MRILTVTLFAALALVLSAAQAGAFAFDMRLNPASADPANILAPSDEVILDVYLDAEPGLFTFAVAVLFDDDGILSYDPGWSSMPTYILYTGGKGATYLVPNINPPGYWNGIQVPPGKRQLYVEFFEVGLRTAPASGTDIWIATLTFHADAEGDGQTNVDLTLDAAGTAVIANDEFVTDESTATGSFTFYTTVGVPTCSASIVATDLGGQTQLDLGFSGDGQGILGLFMRLPNDALVTLFSTGFIDVPLTNLSPVIPQPPLPAGAPGLTYAIAVRLQNGTLCIDESSITF